MSDHQYDLFVIGAGSGGVRSARMAAKYGARVAIAEERYLGGTCVNVGCIPKKLFSYAAHYHQDFVDARGFGWEAGEPAFDWPTLRDNKNCEIERLNGIYGRLLDDADVTTFDGHATLVDKNTVQVGDQRITAANILLAVGGWPYIPDIPGREHVISSNEVFYMDTLPSRAVVVGGGYIACEFASILNGLGVDTTQLYRRDLFLRGFDEEVRTVLAEEMQKTGVDIRFRENASGIERRDDGSLRVTLESGDVLETDIVMYATGRKPLLEGLGLESLPENIVADGYIRTNEYFETVVPGIYALGDATGGMELTPVALAEGMTLAANLFAEQRHSVDYEYIPTAIFSHPNVSTVGYSEEQARERFGDISVYTARFTHLKHTLSGNPAKTFLKLIVEKSTDRVVGLHMVGEEAAEIVQGMAVAIKAGATKADFDATIGIHPTAAEEFVTMREPVR